MSTLAFSEHPSLGHPHQFLSLFETYLSESAGDGDSSSDTKRTYRSNLKQYLRWCVDNSLNPLQIKRADDTATGIIANPVNGHLFVTAYDFGYIVDVDPIAKTFSTLFNNNV